MANTTHNPNGNGYLGTQGNPPFGVGGSAVCATNNSGGVDVIRSVSKCNGSTPTGCVAALPLPRLTIDAGQAAGNEAIIRIPPVDRFYAVGIVARARDVAGADVAARTRLRDIRHLGQSILPRPFNTLPGVPGYSFLDLTFEALRSGANIWPKESPVFTLERPLELVFAADPTLVVGDVIDVVVYARAVSATHYSSMVATEG